MSNWGGYAANQGAFYLNEDAYLLIGAPSPGRRLFLLEYCRHNPDVKDKPVLARQVRK